MRMRMDRSPESAATKTSEGSSGVYLSLLPYLVVTIPLKCNILSAAKRIIYKKITAI